MSSEKDTNPDLDRTSSLKSDHQSIQWTDEISIDLDSESDTIDTIPESIKKHYFKKKELLKQMSYSYPMKKNILTADVYNPKITSTFMTTESLDSIMKKRRNKQKLKDKVELNRNKKLRKILNKVEKEFRESAMRDLVNKFANYIANKCVHTNIPSVHSQSFQRMLNGIVHNLYMSLGFQGNNINMADYTIFETIGYVLVEMIMNVHLQEHIYPKDMIIQNNENDELNYLNNTTKSPSKCFVKRHKIRNVKKK